jgi:cell division protein FtsL
MSGVSPRSAAGTRLGWRMGRFLGFVVLMMCVVATGIYQVHERHKLVQLGYVLDDDRFSQRRLLETNKRLRLALSAHKDPNAVRTIATDRLGMRTATQIDEFRVPDDETVQLEEDIYEP